MIRKNERKSIFSTKKRDFHQWSFKWSLKYKQEMCYLCNLYMYMYFWNQCWVWCIINCFTFYAQDKKYNFLYEKELLLPRLFCCVKFQYPAETHNPISNKLKRSESCSTGIREQRPHRNRRHSFAWPWLPATKNSSRLDAY